MTFLPWLQSLVANGVKTLHGLVGMHYSSLIMIISDKMLPCLRDIAVILASTSPRRLELVRRLGFKDLTVVAPTFEENLDKSNYVGDPGRYALDTARGKSDSVKLESSPAYLVASDTVVACDGDILEKPADREDARRILRQLSGRAHSVFTAVVISQAQRSEEFITEAEVKFASLSNETIDSYIDSGEPMDKAGAYGIQGLGALLVESISGDYYTVVGFPLCAFFQRLVRMCEETSEASKKRRIE